MARYKIIDTNPRLLPVDLSKQLLPGTFEHALNHLLDHEIDLSGFDARYCNDESGASAYPPAMLLKVILFAYAQGIVGSRGIERAWSASMSPSSPCAGTGRRTSPRWPGSSARSGTRWRASLARYSSSATGKA